MNVPTDRKYSETHEWFLVDDNNVVTLGITQFAADELTDITYVELPEEGATVSAGAPIGEVESVKATSEVFTAVGGTVVEVNTALTDHPELINDDAFDEGWLVKIKADSLHGLETLMSAKAYKTFAAAAH
ncbi:MAG: glycine cleavage system protein GcvH [Phycisphaerae bacterium]|jgi:glycine cleavage system H protein